MRQPWTDHSQTSGGTRELICYLLMLDAKMSQVAVCRRCVSGYSWSVTISRAISKFHYIPVLTKSLLTLPSTGLKW